MQRADPVFVHRVHIGAEAKQQIDRRHVPEHARGEQPVREARQRRVGRGKLAHRRFVVPAARGMESIYPGQDDASSAALFEQMLNGDKAGALRQRVQGPTNAFAAAKLSEREAVFSANTLAREAGDHAFGKVGYVDIAAAIAEAQKSGALVPRPFLDRRGTEFAGFTTPSGIETERTMLRLEAAGRGMTTPLAGRIILPAGMVQIAFSRSISAQSP